MPTLNLRVPFPRPHGRSYGKLLLRFFLTFLRNLPGKFGLSFQGE